MHLEHLNLVTKNIDTSIDRVRMLSIPMGLKLSLNVITTMRYK